MIPQNRRVRAQLKIARNAAITNRTADAVAASIYIFFRIKIALFGPKTRIEGHRRRCAIAEYRPLRGSDARWAGPGRAPRRARIAGRRQQRGGLQVFVLEQFGQL